MVFCWVCHHYHDFSLNSCKLYPKWSSCFHSFPPSTSLMHGYLRSFSKAYPDHNILFHYNLQWLPIVPTSSLSFLAWHTRLSLFWSESSFLALSSADLSPLFCASEYPNYSLSSTHAQCVLSLLCDFVRAAPLPHLSSFTVHSESSPFFRVHNGFLWALWLSFSTYCILPCITVIFMHLLDFKLSGVLSFLSEFSPCNLA